VVAKKKRPRAPAWVVGRLVHEALRRWQFPDDNFENFLRPFALESGLTDPAEIHAATQESRRLLERLRAHPLYAELDSAERHHEVPYFLPEERGVIDLLYRAESGWCIIDFKTNEVRSEEEAWTTIQRTGYDAQMTRYARAVADQLKVGAKTRLVFLNVENHLALFDLEGNP
jgi:ATP-dependent exoDNAse (exonuclease V) beta subunit